MLIVKIKSLNPCCDGMFSIFVMAVIAVSTLCLNPCCDGMFSIISANGVADFGDVLILVVMGCFLFRWLALKMPLTAS